MKKLTTIIILLLNYSFMMQADQSLRVGVDGSSQLSKNFDYSKLQLVNQREYTNTTCKSPIKVIGTTGVNGCYFITLWDSQKQVGVAAHWDDDTSPEAIKLLFEVLEENGGEIQNTMAHLVGGWKSKQYPISERTGTFLKKALAEKKVKLNTSRMYERGSCNDRQIAMLDKQCYFQQLALNTCDGSIAVFEEEMPDQAERLLGSNASLKEYQTDYNKMMQCSLDNQYNMDSTCPLLYRATEAKK